MKQLIEAGHAVTGLVRSDKSAAALEAAGGTVLRGDLADGNSLTAGAEAADAVIHFGWMAAFAGMDVPAASALTRERLGWNPTGRGLIEDMERGTYFAA